MTLFRELRRSLDRRRRQEADIRYGLYRAPEGRTGLHRIRRECNDEELVVGSSLAGQTFRPGAVVPLGSHTGTPGEFIIGAPPPGRRGASSFALDFPTPGDLTSVGITEASPETVEVGASSEPVVLTGFGLRSGDTFEAVALNPTTGLWSADPLVTVATVDVPGAETANVTVTVGSSAPVGHRISFRVRESVGADLMRVKEATVLVCPTEGITGKAYLGVRFDFDNLYAHAYADHAWQSQVASVVNPYGSSVRWSERVEVGGSEYAIGKGDNGPEIEVFAWNVDTNTLHRVETGFTGFANDLIGPVVNGSTIYYAVTSDAGNTVTLHSVPVGSTTPSTVGSLSDAGIDWSAGSGVMATLGASTVLIQAFEEGRPVGDQGVWSNPGTSQLRVETFDWDLRWKRNGVKTGSTAVSWGLPAADDELQEINASGAVKTLASISVWSQLNAGFALSPDRTEIAWYPQASGATPSTVFRVKLQDWTSLTGCTVNGTDTVESPPEAPFSTPDAMFPRD